MTIRRDMIQGEQTANLAWPEAPAELRLGNEEAHVWTTWLNCAPQSLEKFYQTLFDCEKARAANFKFETHRNRYIAGRGFVRATLGRYLQADPADLEFVYSAQGKPELTANPDREPLHFNLAHSGDLALLAVTRAGAIGADVEQVRRVKDIEDLVARFFSPRENDAFQKLPDEAKPAAFFNLWTRKEALLKATGEGIAGGLNRVEVSFLAHQPARILAIGDEPESAREWTLKAFVPAENFVGAVAIRARPIQFSFWKI